MIQRRQFVVGGSNHHARGPGDSPHLRHGASGILANRERVAHRQHQLKHFRRDGGHGDDVGNDQSCPSGPGPQLFHLPARLLDHDGGVVHERRREPALQQPDAPFAGPAAEVGARGVGVLGKVRPDQLPRQLIVKPPVWVVIHRIVLPRDAVVVSARGVVTGRTRIAHAPHHFLFRPR